MNVIKHVRKAFSASVERNRDVRRFRGTLRRLTQRTQPKLQGRTFYLMLDTL